MELYDSATGFTATTDLITGRAGHAATLLDTGTVLLAGGAASPGFEYALFNPVTTAYQELGAPALLRRWHTATRLADGKALIAGGEDFTGLPMPGVVVFDPALGFQGVTDAGEIGVPRLQHTATLLANGNVLVTGGVSLPSDGSPGTALSSAEIFELRHSTVRRLSTPGPIRRSSLPRICMRI